MRCLWLTLADTEPAYSGQLLYSGGLIRACADAGAEISVLGLARPGSRRHDGTREGRVTWRLGDSRPYHRWVSVPAALPSQAFRADSAGMHSLLDQLLAQDNWDVIVFDSLCSGWALQRVLRGFPRGRRRPAIVYISHNHEQTLRAQVIANCPNFVRRQALRIDGIKVVALDRALVRSADLVTTITVEDRDRYARDWPEKRIAVLTPGYGGRALPSRKLGRDVPRRAIIVGSFDWIAKRMNLEEFVRAADPIFAARSAELHVVGSAEHSFLEKMRQRVSATRLVGPVDSCDRYMDQSRIAIVPERSGGGFKLKILDYVFNRLPIFAISGSVAGVPLRDGESVALRPTQESLAGAVMDAIDDFDRLNRQQHAAFAACRDKFDWASRGEQLVRALDTL